MRLLWILAGVLAVILGAGGAAYWIRTRPKPAPPKQAAQTDLPPGAEVQINGKIRAVNVVKLPAPIDGVLEEIPVTPGDEVFEGQMIARIKNDNLTIAEQDAASEAERAAARLQALESQLIATRLEQSRLEAEQNRARGELQQRERVFNRQTLLNREGATPRRVFEAAVADYDKAKLESSTVDEMVKQIQGRIDSLIATIESARKTLEEENAQFEKARLDVAAANLLSPVDGLIVAIKKTAGSEVAKEEQDLFEIATDLISLELVLEPPPPVLARLKPGLPALIRIAEVPGEGLPANVKSAAGGVVVLEFASPNPAIRPGMTALAVLKLP